MPAREGRWRALFWITVAELAAMSVWFSASAVAPALERAWQLVPALAPWLTGAVQLGFVAGALIGAATGLPDRVPSRRLFTAAALMAAFANAGLLAAGPGTVAAALGLRLLTGAALAGVYPVAVQWVAAWFPRNRGLAVGILIGGLTVGSALPRLLTGLPLLAHWRPVVAGSSLLALLAAAVAWGLAPDPPQAVPPPPFRWDQLGAVLRDRPVMWANTGYWGHMWELYAMWTWLPAFLAASWARLGSPHQVRVWAGLAGFAAIGGAGLAGALAGGWAADRWGRTAATIAALSLSGSMALLIGFTFRAAPLLTLGVALVWGFAVIADSAQFSAAVTELAPEDRRGTALTFQMATGFLLTVASIDLVAWLRARGGWAWAFPPLAAGPLLGLLAMARLRRHPDALRMAGGRR
ncbi:MFS transporter [Candidatus Hydrogenisulfobacillus filiaventi]|uniref:MFS transporter n=1 Tax=Candidatus Hydrogenisulfobacillus filiaventi TaxID=2707344 RepID=A0A6F8ZFA3_9FIRM|nr:MFS transporter [Candidatus Hydrogenisulfobacillus filiaventi]